MMDIFVNDQYATWIFQFLAKVFFFTDGRVRCYTPNDALAVLC